MAGSHQEKNPSLPIEPVARLSTQAAALVVGEVGAAAVGVRHLCPPLRRSEGCFGGPSDQNRLKHFNSPPKSLMTSGICRETCILGQLERFKGVGRSQSH